ncbi:MAG: glycoside hydrolase family 25 protein [Ruminococcus sp.]|nr:glycoside hydrolase family 25 protein [Ruminococcus sp.]
MKREKWIWILLVLTAFLFVIGWAGKGSGKSEEEAIEVPEVTTEAEGELPKAKDGMYVFVDEEECIYEVELLEDVPECEYDYANLKDLEGVKSYYDEESGIKARIGIDVSEFQGEVDWQLVKDWGAEFAIIRLGYRTFGDDGELVLDVGFEQNMQGALDAGLDVGVYFFSQAVSEEEAREEAEYVLSYIQDYEIKGPVVIDTEEIKDTEARTDDNTMEQYTNNCIVFCETIKSAGYEPMIYANMKWMAYALDLTRLTEYSFWYADYQEEPQCPYDFEIWQYTQIGVIPGIESNVNMNLWFEK